MRKYIKTYNQFNINEDVNFHDNKFDLSSANPELQHKLQHLMDLLGKKNEINLTNVDPKDLAKVTKDIDDLIEYVEMLTGEVAKEYEENEPEASELNTKEDEQTEISAETQQTEEAPITAQNAQVEPVEKF